jgi:hypothetical protein
MLRVFLVATLLEEETAGFLPPAAATARAALASGFQRGMESAALRQMALASDRVARLMALGARLRTLSARAAEVAASAAQLSSLNAPERRLIISRRFSPLGGAALFNFSGFLDRPLRELDFYAGIYDAAVQFATRECEIQGPYPASGRRAPVFRTDAPLVIDPASEDTQRCLGAALLGVVDALQLRRSPRAMFVLASLSRLELAAQLGNQSAADRLLSESSWTWLGAPALPPGEPLAQVFAAVTLRRAPCHPGAHEALCLVEPNLDELLEALRGAGYPGSSPSMREALSDTDRWTAHFARKLMDRAAALAMSPAAAAPGGRSDVVLTGVGLGQLWARRAHTLFDAPALDLDPSSIPERSAAGATLGSVSAAHLLPYRVTLDVVRGGAAFSWLEPSIRISPAFSIDSVADLLGVDGSGRLATTIGLVPTFRTRALALGAGAQTVLPWNGDRVLLPGLFGRLALVQERMAVTAGVYSLSSGHRDALVSLSVSDLNGLAYWLALWAAGRR